MSSYMNNEAGKRAFKKDTRIAKRKGRIAARLKKRAGKKSEREARRNKRKGIVPEPVKKPAKDWGLGAGTTKPGTGARAAKKQPEFIMTDTPCPKKGTSKKNCAVRHMKKTKNPKYKG